MMHRIAIVGSPESVGGFALLGVDIIPVQTGAEAVEQLLRLKKIMQKDEKGVERNLYAIVFITENLAGDITPDDEKRLSRGALPAIVPLPSHEGSGYGLARLKRIVERAVGSDILQ